jgi:hypothetical protein
MNEKFRIRIKSANTRALKLIDRITSINPSVFSNEHTTSLSNAIGNSDMPLLLSKIQLKSILDSQNHGLNDYAYVFCTRIIGAIVLIIDAEQCTWEDSSDLNRSIWISLSEGALDELEFQLIKSPRFYNWKQKNLNLETI